MIANVLRFFISLMIFEFTSFVLTSSCIIFLDFRAAKLN
jgi:hypothetical protein